MTHLFPAVSVDNAPPTPTAPLICHRCGAEPYETDELPCGCVEAFCNACTVAPRHFVYLITASHRDTRPCPQDADDDASECAGSEVAK